MYQDEVMCKACEEANDPVKLRAEIEALRKQNAKNEDDAARFAYMYSGEKTGSNALIEIEMRMLSGEVPSMDEVRAAVDECRKTPNVEGSRPAAGLPDDGPVDRRVGGGRVETSHWNINLPEAYRDRLIELYPMIQNTQCKTLTSPQQESGRLELPRE